MDSSLEALSQQEQELDTARRAMADPFTLPSFLDNMHNAGTIPRMKPENFDVFMANLQENFSITGFARMLRGDGPNDENYEALNDPALLRIPEEHRWRFSESPNPATTWRNVLEFEAELRNRAVFEDASMLQVLGTGAAAIALDPINYLDIFITRGTATMTDAARVMRAAARAKRLSYVNRAARIGGLAALKRGALIGATEQGITELELQNRLQLRSWEESVLAIGGSTLLSAAVGRAQFYIDERAARQAAREMMAIDDFNDLAEKAHSRLASIANERGIDPFTQEEEMVRIFNDEVLAGLRPDILAFKKSKLGGLIPDRIKDGAMNRLGPGMRATLSDLEVMRTYAHNLSSLPFDRVNAPDVVKGVAALEVQRMRFEGEISRVLMHHEMMFAKANTKLTADEFDRLVAEALRRNDKMDFDLGSQFSRNFNQADIDVVNEVASRYREMFDQIEAMAEPLGALEDLQTKAKLTGTAKSYLTRQYDISRIMAEPEDFKKILRAWADQSRDGANENIIERTIDKIRGFEHGGMHVNISYSDALAGRTLEIPDDFTVQVGNRTLRYSDYLVSNPRKLAMAVSHNVVPRILHAHRFMPGGALAASTSMLNNLRGLTAKIAREVGESDVDQIRSFGRDLDDLELRAHDEMVIAALGESPRTAGMRDRYAALAEQRRKTRRKIAELKERERQHKELAEIQARTLGKKDNAQFVPDEVLEVAGEADTYDPNRVGLVSAIEESEEFRRAHEHWGAVNAEIERLSDDIEKIAMGDVPDDIPGFERLSDRERFKLEGRVEDARNNIVRLKKNIKALEDSGDKSSADGVRESLKVWEEELSDAKGKLDADSGTDPDAITKELKKQRGNARRALKKAEKARQEAWDNYVESLPDQRVVRERMTRELEEIIEERKRLQQELAHEEHFLELNNSRPADDPIRLDDDELIEAEGVLDEITAEDIKLEARENELRASLGREQVAGKELKFAKREIKRVVKDAVEHPAVTKTKEIAEAARQQRLDLEKVERPLNEELRSMAGEAKIVSPDLTDSRAPRGKLIERTDAHGYREHLLDRLAAVEGKVVTSRRYLFDKGVSIRRFEKAIDREIDDRIARLPVGDPGRKKLELQRKEAKGDLAAMHRRFLNMPDPKVNPEAFVTRGSNVLRSMSVLTKMGGVTVSSTPDVGLGILVHGFRSWAQSMQVQMRSLRDLMPRLKGNPELRDRMAEMVYGFEVVNGATRMERLTGFEDYRALGQTVPERAAANLRKGFGNVTGISWWNSRMRMFSATQAQVRLVRDVDDFAAGRLKPARLAQLKANRVTEDDLVRWKRMLDKHREEVPIEETKSIYTWARVDEWKDRTARQRWEETVLQFSQQTLIDVGVADLPRVFDDPVGAALLQFKSFAIAATQRTFIAGLQRGDLQFARGMSAMLFFGGFTHIMKEMLAGRDPFDESPAQFVVNAVDRSGMLGIVTDINAMVERATFGKLGLSPLVGAEGVKRYSERNLLDAIAGPNLATLEGLLSVGTLPFRAADQGLQEGDVKSIRRMLPYQNLFYTRLLLDQLQGGVVNGLGVQ